MIELLPAIAGAAVVGITLGLLGSGGSILCVPLLAYVVGRGDKQAIIESLAIVGLIALFGGVRRALAGEVAWRVAVVFAPATMLGAWAGAFGAQWVPGPAQLAGLAVLMLVSAVLMLRGSKANAAEGKSESRARSPLVLGLAGVGVGIITGLVGVGGGFLIVPALVVFAALGHRVAVGTSLMLIAINAGVGFVTYLATEPGVEVSATIVGIFAISGAAGTIVGQRIGTKLDQKMFKRVFAVFLVILGVVMLAREGARIWRSADAPQEHALLVRP
ncbi:MAG: UPF0721 transmembrane protein [Phycisphaeraceae bacterium]|nr:MAG: UPF0721 transmembrane protein [Phycisphaeraceae bacterium]